MIRFVIPGLPPTDNHLYDGGGKNRRRYKTKAAKAWEVEVEKAFMALPHRTRVELRNALWWDLELHFWMRLFTLEGKVQRWDVSSHQKLTVDAVAGLIRCDDARVRRLHVEKHDAPDDMEDRVVVVARPPMPGPFSIHG